MKRSEINTLQKEAVVFFEKQKINLPPWAFWSVNDWKNNHDSAAEVIENKLGWDLTDFGQGDFNKLGLILFTIRNGKLGVAGGKDYSEKIMIVQEEQLTPWHFHWSKMEDIINRGGGNLVMQLCNSNEDELLADTAVTVQVDGITKKVDAKGKIVLKPGESVTLPPFLFHQFYGEKGKGTVLVGEVSRVNDDEKDNRFLPPIGRFSQIEENEPPLYLLCNDYSVRY